MNNEPSTGWRLVIAASWFGGAAVVGGGVWMVGMLMFAFSGDGANAADLPGWLEPAMLVGWPCFLSATAIAPPLLFAFGIRARVSVACLVLGILASTAFYAIGWITLIVHST
ncbi:MAG: hypothetical protein AAF989_14800 [Planctomycetota bacterium]